MLPGSDKAAIMEVRPSEPPHQISFPAGGVITMPYASYLGIIKPPAIMEMKPSEPPYQIFSYWKSNNNAIMGVRPPEPP